VARDGDAVCPAGVRVVNCIAGLVRQWPAVTVGKGVAVCNLMVEVWEHDCTRRGCGAKQGAGAGVLWIRAAGWCHEHDSYGSGVWP